MLEWNNALHSLEHEDGRRVSSTNTVGGSGSRPSSATVRARLPVCPTTPSPARTARANGGRLRSALALHARRPARIRRHRHAHDRLLESVLRHFGNHLDYANWFATWWALRMLDVVENTIPTSSLHRRQLDAAVQRVRHRHGVTKCDAMQRVIAHYYNRAPAARPAWTLAVVKFHNGDRIGARPTRQFLLDD